ncbi:MAG: hypothetical protein J6X53_06750 [Abditibacteriota bacterium]|nr:hypothetical protein [Abditibacteriota bacterium]
MKAEKIINALFDHFWSDFVHPGVHGVKITLAHGEKKTESLFAWQEQEFTPVDEHEKRIFHEGVEYLKVFTAYMKNNFPPFQVLQRGLYDDDFVASADTINASYLDANHNVVEEDTIVMCDFIANLEEWERNHWNRGRIPPPHPEMPFWKF